MGEKSDILMFILDRIHLASTLHHRREPNGARVDFNGDLVAQFVAEHVKKPEPGDVVLCSTSMVSPWKISYLVQRTGHDSALLREIGSERLCNMGNERFETLVGIPSVLLLDGLRRKIFKWISEKAFNEKYNGKADYCRFRCGGVEIVDDDVFRVWIRPSLLGTCPMDVNGKKLYRQPFSVDISFDKKTRLKDIVQQLIDGRMGKDFEISETEPTVGMGGIVTIKR